MKILTISDVPCRALWDYCSKDRLAGIDLILSCGDLPAAYLEHLTNFTSAPILYVHGNHDSRYAAHPPEGCICVDDRIFTFRGLRILGLGGSLRYNQESVYQYTEQQMHRRLLRLWPALKLAGGVDLLLTHSPARGLNDGDDPPHRGFDCLRRFLDRYRPRYFVHGHIHLTYDHRLPRTCTYGSTFVVNATERWLLEIPDP